MAIEKRRVLRRIEFTFTDDQVHPDCHCVYHDEVVEDGEVLMKKNHREVDSTDRLRQDLMNRALYKHPDVSLP